MKKIELTDELLNKEYLKKCSLNITEVREVLGIARDKAQIMVKQIRKNNSTFYRQKSTIYGLTSIAPIHLAEYLEWTREEFFKLIEN